MNSQRNNNRRRGRGNNRGGGGNPSNRIDNRARGNAPQMLDKYKKLAHEASLNDDRVQTEYYLQFADHYFRVIADIQAQKDEQRAKRESDRGQDDDDDRDDDEDDRNDNRSDNRQDDDRQQDRGRNKPQRARSRRQRDDDQQDEGQSGAEGDLDGDDNPFTRDTRKKRAPRKKVAAEDSGLDADRLPPSIARGSEGDDAEAEKPAPKKRATRARRTEATEGDEGPLRAAG